MAVNNLAENSNGEERSSESWRSVLAGEREKPYFQSILAFLEKERAAGKAIYPCNADIFNAMQYTPFETVKVVIIGQDPYFGANQAHGLSFSVVPPVPAPPSLRNIFKELAADLGIPAPKTTSLEKWARQGVLLLNAILTVEAGKPQSHQNIGWQQFTDRIIKEVNERRQGVVFLLWGAFAQRKCAIIDRSRHHVLETTHPSPLSAHQGFLGCRHFSKANQLLRDEGQTEIDWSLV